MRPIIADTETASLEGGVCDLGGILIDESFNELTRFESLIDPERPISPGASGIHHIVDADVVDMPTLAEFTKVYGNPFDCEDLVIIGHNIQFDCRMLGSILPEQYRKLCTLKLARELYPELDNHQLQTIRYSFGLEAGPAHRAMGDVITCLSFLRHIAQDKGLDIHEMLALCSKPMTLQSKLTGGKHKGLRICELPMSYVNWMLNKAENLDPELRTALTLRLA